MDLNGTAEEAAEGSGKQIPRGAIKPTRNDKITNFCGAAKLRPFKTAANGTFSEDNFFRSL